METNTIGINYTRRTNGKDFSTCSIETFRDGSVYIEGDEIEMIFEFAPDCLERAIRHVEEAGYVRQTPAGQEHVPDAEKRRTD